MNNELYHYGIKGMRWGVRRYQHKDGSPTKAGIKRQRKGLNDAFELAKSHAIVEDSTRNLHKGWDGQSMILVSPEAKQSYTKMAHDYINRHEIMSKKYKILASSIITEKGRDYAYALLEDRITGEGYENKVELHEQR